jgi:hypothetical protein
MFGSRSSAKALLGIVLGCATARGDPDPARADRAFEQGKGAIAAGDWRRGCALFAESMEADPSPSTELKLARCAERDGKLVEAARLVASARARNVSRNGERPELRDELERLAARWLGELSRRTPQLRVDVTAVHPELRVTVDGTLTDEHQYPVDAGPHRIVIEAPGFESLALDVTLAEGERRTIVAALVPLAPTADAAPVRREPATPTEPRSRAAWPVLSIGAAALASAATAVYFGAKTRSDVVASNASCNASDGCLAAGVALRDHARTERLAAWVFGVVGVGLGATAITLHLSAAPSDTSVTVAGRW